MSNENKWKFRWPNSADNRFNYYNLLENPIAKRGKPGFKVAIVGAGIAGLTAARELARAGFTHIDVFEATDRIGGRAYSVQVPRQQTMYELGAMRIPFFDKPGSKNSVMDYYATKEFKFEVQDFPNPGSDHCDTGIYVNLGTGTTDRHPPDIDDWRKDEKKPPKDYQPAHKKWEDFQAGFEKIASKKYGSSDWTTFWHKVVHKYSNITFRGLVQMPVAKPGDMEKGDLGGLGMSDEEARLFYVIGGGDGGWGAFYEISSLFVIRTLLCGFNKHHQLVVGRMHQPTQVIEDVNGAAILVRRRGIQALAECLLLEPIKETGKSPLSSGSVRLHLNTHVRFVKRIDKHKIRATIESPGGKTRPEMYSAIVFSPTTWALQESVGSKHFDEVLPEGLRPDRQSLNQSHWISSCKVFFPLKERYWKYEDFPQTLVTDTFIRDVYGYAYGNDPGVLLASYTWEDDADKLISEPESALATRCLSELDHILASCTSRNRKGFKKKFVDERYPPVVMMWRKHQDYRGCAKLYRAGSWNDDRELLLFNREKSKDTSLYLAGEAYSVEGGWIEPALRSALDAVIHICRNAEVEFQDHFDYDSDYVNEVCGKVSSVGNEIAGDSK